MQNSQSKSNCSEEAHMYAFNYFKSMKWIAPLTACITLTGCPPLFMPTVKTSKWDVLYSFPDNPKPWVSLEQEGINLYKYYKCDKRFTGEGYNCNPKLVGLSKNVTPNFKILLEANYIEYNHTEKYMARPLSAYTPETKKRFLNIVGSVSQITIGDTVCLASEEYSYTRRCSSRTDLGNYHNFIKNIPFHPAELRVQLVIYDDNHQWIFTDPFEFNKDIDLPPPELFIPGKLFHFDILEDERLTRPMALFYADLTKSYIADLVVSGKAKKWVTTKYKTKSPAHQISISDIPFPSVALRIDNRTVAGEDMQAKPTLLCHYGSVEFGIGLFGELNSQPPTEKHRKDCEPFHGQKLE